jgi:hypothetical protein
MLFIKKGKIKHHVQRKYAKSVKETIKQKKIDLKESYFIKLI